MEAYIDDMLLKSKSSIDEIASPTLESKKVHFLGLEQGISSDS